MLHSNESFIPVLVPCVCRFVFWTLFARAPVLSCLAQYQSPRLATTAVALAPGGKIVGANVVDGLGQPLLHEVSHALGLDMLLVYKFSHIVIISALVL